jgi:hypothetical protein
MKVREECPRQLTPRRHEGWGTEGHFGSVRGTFFIFPRTSSRQTKGEVYMRRLHNGTPAIILTPSTFQDGSGSGAPFQSIPEEASWWTPTSNLVEFKVTVNVVSITLDGKKSHTIWD